MVARPGIVDGALAEGDSSHGVLRQCKHESLLDGVGVLGGDDESFALGDDAGQLDEGVGDFLQIGVPVGSFVRPCELNGALRIPFSGQDIVGFFHVV